MTRPSAELDLAARLRQARASGQPLSPPTDPGFDLTEAYRIQRRGRRYQVADGDQIAGWKVGVTASSAQAAFAIDHPVSGYLSTETIIAADTARVEAPRALGPMVAPRVEIEVAFVLAAPLVGPGLTVRDVLDATARLHLALEIVDSRWAGGAPTAELLVADNVSNAGVVLGAEVDTDADLGTLRASLRVGQQHSQGGASEVLGHPARALAWLAAHLAEQGEMLRPGQLILSGTLCPPLPLDSGNDSAALVDIVADFADLGTLHTALPTTPTAHRPPPPR